MENLYEYEIYIRLDVGIEEKLITDEINQLEYLLENTISHANTSLVDQLDVSDKIKELWHAGFDVAISSQE